MQDNSQEDSKAACTTVYVHFILFTPKVQKRQKCNSRKSKTTVLTMCKNWGCRHGCLWGGAFSAPLPSPSWSGINNDMRSSHGDFIWNNKQVLSIPDIDDGDQESERGLIVEHSCYRFLRSLIKLRLTGCSQTDMFFFHSATSDVA